MGSIMEALRQRAPASIALIAHVGGIIAASTERGNKSTRSYRSLTP